MTLPMPSTEILTIIKSGIVIPASPLALDENRKLDTKHQIALYRYYATSGAGGIAVGVHTTQFGIREKNINLFHPLLKLASDTIDNLNKQHQQRIVKIAGICGETTQAIKEADSAQTLGYDLGLLSLAAMKDTTEDQLIHHCKKVSKVIPLIGFYLQPAAGGIPLPFSFWRRFVEIPNVIAIKIAPFNRYQTLDVIRAVALLGRENEITLYTGNDDNIILDLLTPYSVMAGTEQKIVRIRGGLLGQWSVWTSKAVKLLKEIHSITDNNLPISMDILQKNSELTDANSVLFDAAHQFKGCIPGIHEILKLQGLFQTTHCLNSNETLSPGQSMEIDRIYRDYPWLTDNDFVKANLLDWLSD